MNAHRLAEERSIAYHAAVADRLPRDGAVLARARARVAGWRRDGSVAAPYVEGWERLLALPLDELRAALIDPSEPARALRQATPFAGAIPARERWVIWKTVRARFERESA